ncbi:hypothetical protein C8035_v008616 [Colletotrichum spinosum]|uniref:Rhodopsin domain-containing protein n=1 Tax=Colletotrichum spinosum TaxID=1347390 RepID=A0A4V3HQI2_9PEZI|nr:hypothetical protein C8035_v008616 [Colletotrichum spinosum]
MSANAAPTSPAAAAQAAAYDAVFAEARRSTVEAWTLYAIGMAATALRTYARTKAVGVRNFRADDYLAWVAASSVQLFYTAQSTLAYEVGDVAHGLANNGMTRAERLALSTDSPEYQRRVIGSKIQVAGWTTYSALIWLLKLSMLIFYLRLMQGLERRYRVRIWVGVFLVIGTFFASIGAVCLACVPFQKYWQVSPDPGRYCQAATSLPVIWTSFASNVSTDIYILLIPIPLLWESKLKLAEKIALTIVLGAGMFVLVCATLKSVFVLIDPINGAQLAGTWGTRETFVATITTNLPMIFPLLRGWFLRLYPRDLRELNRNYERPDEFQTMGGGDGQSESRERRIVPSAKPVAMHSTFSESDERMVGYSNMPILNHSAPQIYESRPAMGIFVSSEVEIITENRPMRTGEKRPPHPPEVW